MRKTTAFIIVIALIFSVLAGTVFFASAAPLDEAMAAAKPELYGLYTPQSAGLLRDAYDRAAAGDGDGSALLAALDALAPLENYKRETLIGFSGLDGEDIAAMKLCRGEVSVCDGAVTLSGEGTLRYCNAVRGGIAGPSPFGMATPDADGFVLAIDSAADARLDIEIGRRGSSDDCVFTLSDVFVANGERYYFFPFERFGDLPLDGTLNYISLTFTGTSAVSFCDLHAASAGAEGAAEFVYSEEPMTAQNFDPAKFYKILQHDTDLALTVVYELSTRKLVFAANAGNDDSQLWQIVRDPAVTSRFRLVNKLTGLSLQQSADGSLSLTLSVADYTNAAQKWSCTYNRTRGFSFYLANIGKLSYLGSKARLSGTDTATKYFDVVCTGGEEWTQVWSDEFNTLDRSVWYVMNAKNRGPTEPMFNRDSPNNLYIEDGNLVIKTIKEEYLGYHATSAYLSTEEKVQFTYGRMEMRAKLPEGRKIWPAFWMMGEDERWPRCGEIDVVEMVGSGPDDDYLGERGSIATFHYDKIGIHIEEGGNTDGNTLRHVEKLSENYHTYAIEWDETQVRWYFDDTLYLTVNSDTPEKMITLQENPMFLILDTSIEGPGNNQLPEGMPDEAYFYIDYIRYYKSGVRAKPADTIPYGYESGSPDYYEAIWSPAHIGAYCAATDRLVYCNAATVAVIYDVTSMTHVASRNLMTSGWSMSCAVSADGSTAVFGRERKITVSKTDLLVPMTEMAEGMFPTIALSNDGSRCYYGAVPNERSNGYCDYFRIFECEDLTEIANEYTGSWVDSIAVAADDTYAYGCFDGKVRVRSASDADLGGFTAEGRVISLAFSPDCKTIYAADGALKIYKYDIASGETKLLAVCADEVYKLAVSPDGKRLAAACGDSCARVYDVETGRLAARPCLGRLTVTEVVYSADGKLLLLGCTDGRIGVYRASDGLPLALLYDEAGGGTWYHTIAISPDNRSVMAIRGREDFSSAVAGWRIPELLSECSDSSVLAALPYYDEAVYTAESYAPYAVALKNAHAVRTNRYSSQSAVGAALAAVEEAAGALVETGADFIKGDLDGDGEITVSDALAALRIAAKLAEETPESILIGDADGDGRITVSDALAILRVAAKLADAL